MKKAWFLSAAFMLTAAGCGTPPALDLVVPAALYRGNAATLTLSVSAPGGLLSPAPATAFLFQSTSDSPNQPVATLSLENGVLETNLTLTVARYGSVTQEEFRLELSDSAGSAVTVKRDIQHYSLAPGGSAEGQLDLMDVFDMYELVLPQATNLIVFLAGPGSMIDLYLYNSLGGPSIDSHAGTNTWKVLTNTGLPAGTYYIKTDRGVTGSIHTYTLSNTVY